MSSLSAGRHTFTATANTFTGNPASSSASFNVSQSKISIDSPSSGGTYLGSVAFGGWALDSSSAVRTVALSIDGTSFGNASYGGNRQDVCNAMGNAPGCPNVGWNAIVNTAKLSGGAHTLLVTITTADGRQASQSRIFNVRQAVTSYSIDAPTTSGAALLGQQHFAGWAVDNAFPISSVAVSIDGASYPNASYGGNRQDVCNALGNNPGCPYVGWDTSIDTAKLVGGSHVLTIRVTTSDGRQVSGTRNFTVQQALTIATIDFPGANGTYIGTQTFNGWAIDNAFAISSVQLSIDGVAYPNASYGGYRQDVCTAIGNDPGCPYVGWATSVDLTRLAAGSHTLAATANTSDGRSATSTRIFINQLPTTNVQIDLPVAQQTYSGKQVFSGWAYSNYTTVSSVGLSLDGVNLGNASYGGSRVDVCTAGQHPGCPNVGWSYSVNTATLLNQSHTLVVNVTTADGKVTSKSLSFSTTNNNNSLIGIDSPTLANTYFGNQTFAGWAIDANSTIQSVSVMVDSSPYTASYGLNRQDVCAQYSGSPGCPNVGWSVNVNTSAYAKGAHTLTVTAVTSDPVPRRTSKSTQFFVGSGVPSADVSKEYIYVNGRLTVVENPQ